MLVRNHILYYKGEMEKQIGNGTYPPIYYRATPPKIDRFYMARADEIRKHAARTLAAIKENPDIAYIRKKMYAVDKDCPGKTAASHVLTYQQRLSDAIEKDELLEMRRFEKTDRVMAEIQECADKLREYVPTENIQLNVFDMLDDADHHTEEIDLKM